MIPLHEFKRKFATEKQCIKYLLYIKLGADPCCPKCDKPWKKILLDEYWFRCHYRCSFKECITKYTIFYQSPIPLQKWFLTIYLMIETNNKISGVRIKEQVGVGLVAAYNMKKKILALADEINLEEFFDYNPPSPLY